MFNIVAHFFASIASFLFPLFASYKALKTSDPAQLTPWLMYWSVLSCALLAESWTEFILAWIPFYSWIRLGFLLWLVLPSTQGARVLYEGYLHPYLEENELAIEDFIASAHDRFKAAGLAYLKQAIELVRTRLLGLPPRQQEEPRGASAAAADTPQGYTQALLARFSVPAARWAANNAGTAGHDFYNLLAGAVGAAVASSSSASGGNQTAANRNISTGGTLIPDNINGAAEKISFIAAQRERLAFMLGALDREAAQLQHNEQLRQEQRPGSMSLDGGLGGGQQQQSRPTSGYSGLSKSRSEVDFEKIDTPSGTEDDDGNDGLRRRGGEQQQQSEARPENTKRGWSFLGWGSTPTAAGGDADQQAGQSSGYEQQQQ